ncbi:MAG: GNAT family N-acetyltransferase [Planctomycetota bacterium]
MAPKLEQISVRRATVKDARVLSVIGELTFTQSYASIIPPKELTGYTSRAFSVEQLKSELTVPSIIYLLATINATHCGYSKLEPNTPPLEINCSNPIELVRLYVLPEWIGKGIGTKLFRRSLDVAIEGGYLSCWLRVWEGNERAIMFYRNRGFREVGSAPYYVGKSSEMVLIMNRVLKEMAFKRIQSEGTK